MKELIYVYIVTYTKIFEKVLSWFKTLVFPHFQILKLIALVQQKRAAWISQLETYHDFKKIGSLINKFSFLFF